MASSIQTLENHIFQFWSFNMQRVPAGKKHASLMFVNVYKGKFILFPLSGSGRKKKKANILKHICCILSLEN